MDEQHFIAFKMNLRYVHEEFLGVMRINWDDIFSFSTFLKRTLSVFMAGSAEPQKVQKLLPSYRGFLAACYKQNELPFYKIPLKTGFERTSNLITLMQLLLFINSYCRLICFEIM